MKESKASTINNQVTEECESDSEDIPLEIPRQRKGNIKTMGDQKNKTSQIDGLAKMAETMKMDLTNHNNLLEEVLLINPFKYQESF